MAESNLHRPTTVRQARPDATARAARIVNWEALTSHGNAPGRSAALEILEAGLSALDPYDRTAELVRLEGARLIVGNPAFEPSGSPNSGDSIIDLDDVDNIYVFGAGKGIQRVARALEDILGDRLTGGHVIDKKGHEVILERVEVTLGGHPIPDADCVAGCERILSMTQRLTAKDLVFTCVANGVSSLLTLPVPGVTLEDVQSVTQLMQIQRGAPTADLNAVRQHLDRMKGGRISRHIQPARAIHVLVAEPASYEWLTRRNFWLHTLPDGTTFDSAVSNLKKWGVWDHVPRSVTRFLRKADPRYGTVSAEEFEAMAQHRVFCIMPPNLHDGAFSRAAKKARELGYSARVLAHDMRWVEPLQAARVYSEIARTVEKTASVASPPCALFSAGEMTVRVGEATGTGGRNQEFALAVAQDRRGIAGSSTIVVASVDTDGTDGPGFRSADRPEGMPACLAGGIVDGYTTSEAERFGVDISDALERHDSSAALWKLGSAIQLTPSVSMGDFTVILVTDGRK